MAVGIQKAWSLVANNNGNADNGINWAEGMGPPQINNSARAEMAAIKGFANQILGAKTTGGSSNAYTFTSDSVAAISDAYGAGMGFVFKANHTNTGAATLNVDSVGAKSIKKGGAQSALAANDIVSGGIYQVFYEASGDCFILTNPETGQTALDAMLAALAGTTSSASQYLRATGSDTLTWDSYATLLSNIGAVPTTRLVSSGTGLAGGGDLTGNLTLSVNQAFTPTWTGLHTFQRNGNVVTFTPATGTNAGYFTLSNSGGNKFIGIESSTGGALISGSTAYALCFVTETSRPMQWATNNTLAMTLDTSQNLTVVGTVTGSSDRRLKTDIDDLATEEALSFVRSLRPRTFSKRGVALMGFIAQEVAEVDQRFVFETDDAAKTLAIPAGAEWAAPIVRTLQYLLDRVEAR